MLTHNNGRFYRGSASFSLPNNCKVLTDGTYGQYDGLAILPQDERFTVEIDFLQRDRDYKADLLHSVETAYKKKGIVELAPVQYAHASGWEVTYPEAKLFAHEIWLAANEGYDFGEEKPFNVLAILITSETCHDIEEIKRTELFRELVDGVMADRYHE